MRAVAPLVALGLLAACSGGDEPAAEDAPDATPTPEATPAPQASATPAPTVADFPALSNKDCATVAQFYFDAVSTREFARAALVWNDQAIDAQRLAGRFATYQQPIFAPKEPQVEGAAGSLYCTVEAELSDAANIGGQAMPGTLTLRRANDVPGATADQLRWTLQMSTFVELLERSDNSGGA